MNEPTYIEVPLTLVGKRPDLIATYLALRTAAVMTYDKRWTMDQVAHTANIDAKVVRLNLLQLRVMGFVRLRVSVMAREMLDDLGAAGIQLIDQQMSFAQLAAYDPRFEPFAASVISDSAAITRWASDEASKDIQDQRRMVIADLLQTTCALLAQLGREDFAPPTTLSPQSNREAFLTKPF